MQGPSTVSFDRIDAAGLRLAVVTTTWNAEITDRLLAGALACLEEAGLPPTEVTVLRCPGAFELPLTLQSLADTLDYDGLIALGAVIRGETPHFDFVAAEASSGIMRVSLEASMPIGFGLLTVDTLEQAAARADEGRQNKGWEAAATTLAMCRLIRGIATGE